MNTHNEDSTADTKALDVENEAVQRIAAAIGLDSGAWTIESIEPFLVAVAKDRARLAREAFFSQFPPDTDPEDSDRLRELRDLIDEELGWPTMAAQEAGDYAERIRQVAAQRKEIAKEWEACQRDFDAAGGRLGVLLDVNAREVARNLDDPDETSSARKVVR